MACSVFIIYKRSDAAEGDKIYTRLKREGYSPWMDRQDLQISDWQSASEARLHDSDLILVCVSKNSGERGRYHREIQMALKRNEELPPNESLIVPVRIEDCKLPANLSRFHAFDLFQNDGWIHLLRALREKCPRPHRAQPPVRVLVVDDQQIWRQLVREKVEEGIRSAGGRPECHEVESFEKAWRMLLEGHWDLLVTDIAMTDSDRHLMGMYLADRAQQLRIKCIVVTGDPQMTMEHTYKLGRMGAGYYPKSDLARRSDEFMNEVRTVCK